MNTAELLASAARKGAAMGDCGKMCSDCAFKYPQPNINFYEAAIDGAADALMMGRRFNCHTPEYSDAGRPCVGFAYAQQYFDSLDKG